MKLNFKKISAIAASTLLAGMSVGLAAAANYPAPFVNSAGAANVAVVYGTGAGVSSLDLVQAGNIQTSLASSVKGGTTTIDGEYASLGSGSTKIWLNTSLNTAKTTLTKSDLPTVLEQTTFSGNVDSKLTSTLTIGSNTVTFAKQPSSNEDPVIGVAMNTAVTGALYNASVTMPAIAFNSSDSEGETIKLFGRDFVVSTATDGTSLVLFSSAEEIALSVGGTNPTSKTVIVGGVSYDIELVTGSSTTSATISVNGESKAVTAGNSKKINGLEVALKSVTESTALNKIDATLLVGSEKITFTDGSQVLKGSEDDPVDGTMVFFTGTVDALTGLTVSVFAPDNSNDALLAGESFKDPVFESFSLVFTGLSSGLDDASREMISIGKSGDKGMSLTMTDSDGVESTFDFAYNSTTTFLGDSNGYKIGNLEGATIFPNNYTMIGNEDYGHLVQLTRVYNFTGTDYSKDAVTFKDVISGESYSMDSTAEGTGRLTVDGRQYTVTYLGTGDAGNATLKYPTSDTSATQYVLFPTIKTENDALVSLYEPQTITLATQTGFKLPDGDGYTTVTFANESIAGYLGNWSVDSSAPNLNLITGSAASTVNVTVGQLTYMFAGTGTNNSVSVKLVNPNSGAAPIVSPGVVVFEGKDDSSNYEAIVIDLETHAAGTSSDPLGVNDVYFTSPTLWDSVSLQSDSDISQSVDWWGALVSEDSNTASQKVVSISYPKEQVYADLAIAEASATSQAGALGDVLVKDSEVSSVASKNLVIVGGSCINSAAATALGGAYCGDAFTAATGVSAGEFLIKGVQDKFATGKLALVVAGYEAADTVNAATYLTKKVVDTSKEYKGTSATEATLVTTAA